MRIFLLRLLIGWWMILLGWPLIVSLNWLMFGDIAECVDNANDMAHALWYGEER